MAATSAPRNLALSRTRLRCEQLVQVELHMGSARETLPAPLDLTWTPPPHSFTPDQVAHVEPNLRPNAPRLRHVGPQLGSTWGQLARVRRKLGPSWAPVQPNLRPRTAKFDPGRLLVGPSRLASFLFPECARSDSNQGLSLKNIGKY